MLFCVQPTPHIIDKALGAIIVLLASLLAVLSDSVSAGLGGLSITYALSVTQTLNWFVRMNSDCETQVVAAEVGTESNGCFYHARAPLG